MNDKYRFLAKISASARSSRHHVMRITRRTQREILTKIYAHKVHSRDVRDMRGRAGSQPFGVTSPFVPIPGCLPASARDRRFLHFVSRIVHD
ncbi:hypothetical protein [Burkholderia sp. LAS2]|uniref:hypothetical protein n=1 Tax=Burkholderia sp. LAS2 TaxID=2813843 RepID=UPI001BCE18F3|nr:hypothetical protein [Burkholderia sp. LAS2]QVN14067.1 hypothetical protein JYG37_26800 [Burkholderia sp. LAS2]